MKVIDAARELRQEAGLKIDADGVGLTLLRFQSRVAALQLRTLTGHALRDGVDAVYNGVADLIELLYRGLSLTENGRVRWYAAAIAAGTVVFVAIALFL